MGKKRLIILIGIIIVCTGGVLAEKSLVDETNGSTHTQWEYGVYRARANYWSWQNLDRRVWSNELTTFLQRMGLKKLSFTKAESDTMELDLLNFLGEQGWELFLVREGAPGQMDFWFKRPK